LRLHLHDAGKHKDNPAGLQTRHLMNKTSFHHCDAGMISDSSSIEVIHG
jgi:hypothetical protein